eukprot:1527041-Rhodomonas_salina.1
MPCRVLPALSYGMVLPGFHRLFPARPRCPGTLSYQPTRYQPTRLLCTMPGTDGAYGATRAYRRAGMR